MYVFELKVELDIERHVLTQTKKLSDGSYEKIFTRNRRNESGMFTYNCRLCSVARYEYISNLKNQIYYFLFLCFCSLPGERAISTHIAGKKHQQRLQSDYVPNAQIFRGPITQKQKGLLFSFQEKN